MQFYDVCACEGQALVLGRLGENLWERIIFDVGGYIDKLPEASVTLINRLPKGTDAYPVANAELDGTRFIWTITNAELTQTGIGECELIITSGDRIAKSIIWQTYVSTSLDGSGEAPEPWDSWQTVFAQMKADAEAAAAEAEAASQAVQNMGAEANTLLPSQAATVTKIVDPETGAVTLVFGIPQGVQGEQGEQGEQGQTGATGNGIASIVKTGTQGLVDTYTITFTNGGSATFTVTNGAAGKDGADGKDGENGSDGFSPTVTITEITGGHRVSVTDINGTQSFDVLNGQNPTDRITTLDGTPLEGATVLEAIGIPEYVSNASQYSDYGLTESGWYIFARIAAKDGVTVTVGTSVTGAAGVKQSIGATYVDVAVRFGVAAESQCVTVNWGNYSETFVFKATDLAVRNLDYRTTFYVYDLAEFVTWQYTLTADATFVADKQYYTKDGDVYTLAEVTAGEAVPADTYYNHSKLTISGMTRNITYRLDEIVDCPQEVVLPDIDDDTHGAWFEFQLRHSGTFSMTLTVPEGVKIATEHTQSETAGFNLIDLHYMFIDGVKMWRFMNTHSSIPTT